MHIIGHLFHIDMEKRRGGFTLIETVVSFALFSIIITVIVSSAYTSSLVSSRVSKTIVEVAHVQNAIQYMQDEFEGIQRTSSIILPTVEPLSPLTGDVIEGGSTITLRWKISGDLSLIHTFGINFHGGSADPNVKARTVLIQTSNFQITSVQFTVPAGYDLPYADFQFVVRRKDGSFSIKLSYVHITPGNSNPLGFTTNNFGHIQTVVADTLPTATITSPNGGEHFFCGSSIRVGVSLNGDLSKIYQLQIYVSYNNGGSWIHGLTAMDGGDFIFRPTNNFSVPVSQVTNQALVKVVLIRDASCNWTTSVDISDNVFIVLPAPTLTISQPSTGQIIQGGANYTIILDIGNIAQENLQYIWTVSVNLSVDGGQNWIFAAQAVWGGPYPLLNTTHLEYTWWYVPEVSSDNCILSAEIMGMDCYMGCAFATSGVFTIVPPAGHKISSIEYKKSTLNGSLWNSLYVNGNSLLTGGNGTVLLKADQKIDGNNYFYLDFYAPNNVLIGSNHETVPTLPNFTFSPEYWKMKVSFVLDNQLLSVVSIRKVTPYFVNPRIVDTNGNSYIFSLPLDTDKPVSSDLASSYSNCNTVISSALPSTFNSKISSFSSYLGISAINSSKFYGISYNSGNYFGYLQDLITGEPIKFVHVYIFYVYGDKTLIKSTVTGFDGSFYVAGPLPASSVTIRYFGGSVYGEDIFYYGCDYYQ